MALVTSCTVLVAVALLALLAAALGQRLLRLAGLELPNDAEHLLCSVALGVIAIESLLFFVQLSNHIRAGVIWVWGLALLLGLGELADVFRNVLRVVRRAFEGSTLENILGGLTFLILLLEGLAAMAPLTGSDALHYHFTAPLLELQTGFHPDFFLSHSFFCGQSHLLILSGLALGSSQLAMGLLFLGGALAAAAGGCLARRLSGRVWGWTAALLFLSTPVVFWQISSAGAPDLWMAFFVTLGVLVISRCREMPSVWLAAFAGVLAGGVAGTKYTGCLIAASMAVAFFWEARSASKGFLFVAGALGAGILPYARNFAWTGDPVFPFLTRWISPERVNSFTLASYLADTGAGEHRTAWQLLKFPFFARIDPLHPGLWQDLGPLVLALAPLLILTVKRTSLWRAGLTIWFLSALGIGVTSGMTRFLLPVLPIAIAAVIAGIPELTLRGWKAARFISVASLLCCVLLGGTGLLVYDSPAWSAAAGFTAREAYLRRHAPEYEKAEFINRTLAGLAAQGKTLVFLRHLYYLRVPFLPGDPTASWAIDTQKLQTPKEWEELFRAQNIRWVVRSPDYPREIAAPLNELERQGKLTPLAKSEVADFRGMRIGGQLESTPIVILRVSE